jgi:hypothetical protein
LILPIAGKKRRVSRVALVHRVVQHDAVAVVEDLCLVAELHRLAEPALHDRPGLVLVQADQPGGRVYRLPGQPGAGLASWT